MTIIMAVVCSKFPVGVWKLERLNSGYSYPSSVRNAI